MQKRKVGQILLSLIVVTSALVSIAVDWNNSHVFNPEWVPHARFHDIMLLVTLVGIMVVSLWLIWRRSREPKVGVRAATLLQLFFWGSFYLAVLIPGASPVAITEFAHPPKLVGLPLYPNMTIALVSILLALLADWLYHSGSPTSEQPREVS